jgi:hypothetical protein
MAVPPTIPTSFVPHPGGAQVRRSGSDITGAFGFFAYFVFALAVVSGVAVFGYNQLLAKQQERQDAAVAEASQNLDKDAATSVIRLRDRLVYGDSLLNNHTALSNAFARIQTVLPKTVRFTEMGISTDEAGRTTLTAAGVAKTFNALAAASNAFGSDGGIKDAIFSSITVTDSNTVEFSLHAIIDPALMTFTGAPLQTAPQQQSAPVSQPVIPETL